MLAESYVTLSMLAANSRPLISVVTVVFNGANTLRETIESIVPQLCADAEYLIIDGGSTDGTVDIIREYESYLAYWVSKQDSGIYDAWNKGIDASNGNYLSFVGADDVLEPNALKTYIEHIKSSPTTEYFSSRLVMGNRQGRVIGKPWAWHSFRRYMTVAHVGSLQRRDLYARFGKYDTSYRIVGDYEFLLRVGKKLQSGFVDVVTVVMGEGGVSSKEGSLALKETRLAKISTRACSKQTAFIDYIVAVIKLYLREFLSHYRLR